MSFVQSNNPFKKRTKAKGGGTTKVCLPKAKIASMSQSERQAVIRLVNTKDLVKVMLLEQVAVEV